MMSEIAISVKNISKTFTTRSEKTTGRLFERSEKITKKVIDDISFDVKKGEVFGIIGRNGSGKSTILKMLSSIMKPDSGTIEVNGRVASILELGMGFHKDMSGRENIYVKGTMYGFSRGEIDNRIDDIVKYADLGEYIDLPIRVYSSGMVGRLAFAIMINVDADIMILDEILSTGDLAFGKKSGSHFSNMKSKSKTIILVAHSMPVMREMCDRVVWIDDGRIKEIGSPNVICGRYETELTESLDIITELAESGVATSQNMLGVMYRDGDKVEKNMEKAVYWLELAAKRDNNDAKINLADIIISNQKDEGYDKALDLYMSAARRGNRNTRTRRIARTKLSRLLTSDRYDVGKEIIEDFKELLPSGNPSLYYEYADLLMKTAWGNEDRMEALRWYEKSAEHGNMDAMYQISLMYRDGRGPARDSDKHVEWMIKAAENGNTSAQLFLGNMYRDGIMIENNESEAFCWYKMAAENNNLDAIYQVSTMYREGIGVEENREESDRWLRIYARHNLSRQIDRLADSYSHCKNDVYNPEKGLKWYSMNAESGNADAKYRKSMMLTDGGELEKNASEIASLLLSAAEKGHLPSARSLAWMHTLGVADKDVRDNAISTLEDLADTGNMWAANTLGEIYAEGKSVEPDGEKAVKYFKMAAKAGIVPSIRKLGRMYSEGTMVEQDVTEAAKWFREGVIAKDTRSAIDLLNLYCAEPLDTISPNRIIGNIEDLCISGDTFAIRTLAGYYFNGIITEQDTAKGINLYKTAANLGDTHSMNRLGEIYRDGINVEKDAEEAIKWFKTGTDRGHLHSIRAIIEMYDVTNKDDFDYAFKRLKQIAIGGNVWAMRDIATIYLEGKLVPKDNELAKMWFERAACLGNQHSINKLKSLE